MLNSTSKLKQINNKEVYMTKTNLSTLQNNNNKEVYMTKTNSSLLQNINKIKEGSMTKKLLSVLLVLSVICSSAFAYSNDDHEKSIGIITFQGPDDETNVALSSLFAIKLVNSGNFDVISGKGEKSQIESENTYSSLYSSDYENEAIRIAKKLDVDYILLGQINRLGEKNKLMIRVIDIKGNHIAGAQCTFENPEDIERWIDTMCMKIASDIDSNSSQY